MRLGRRWLLVGEGSREAGKGLGWVGLGWERNFGGWFITLLLSDRDLLGWLYYRTLLPLLIARVIAY